MPRVSSAIRGRLPWWAKFGAKTLLYSLPIDYGFFRALSLFRHGGMERPEWAYATFRRHYDAVDFPRKDDGFALLELGPGDSLFTAPIAAAHGASRVYLVDVGPFANQDPMIYRAMVEVLDERGLAVSALRRFADVPELLSACGAWYGTEGLASLRALPDASVDFAFSNTVLQHVRRRDFAATLRELRRVLRPGGVCAHTIDLRDMMAQALNHLRFSERAWESPLVARSGFYTNRLRYSEMFDEFRQAGFETEVTERDCWERLPTPRARLARPYRDLPDGELCVATFHVILR